MPRGGYDCTGAAPGSWASNEMRQLLQSQGGSTPRASHAAVLFPGGMQQQQMMPQQMQQMQQMPMQMQMQPQQYATAVPMPVAPTQYPNNPPYAMQVQMGVQQPNGMAMGYAPAPPLPGMFFPPFTAPQPSYPSQVYQPIQGLQPPPVVQGPSIAHTGFPAAGTPQVGFVPQQQQQPQPGNFTVPGPQSYGFSTTTTVTTNQVQVPFASVNNVNGGNGVAAYPGNGEQYGARYYRRQ